MVYVEFTLNPAQGSTVSKDYFVGKTLQDVLNDTNGGTEFGGRTYESYRTISAEDAIVLDLGFLKDGVRSIQDGTSVSYMLDRPKTAVNK
jgi:hypothetical protein